MNFAFSFQDRINGKILKEKNKKTICYVYKEMTAFSSGWKEGRIDKRGIVIGNWNTMEKV